MGEHAARDPVGRLRDDGLGTRVEQDTGQTVCLPGAGPVARELEQERPAVGAAQPHPAYVRLCRPCGPAAQRPQSAHVLRQQPGGQRLHGVRVEVRRLGAEDQARLVVRGDRSGGEVPVEVADPHRLRGFRGQPDGHGVAFPLGPVTVPLQLRDVGAEMFRDALQPVAVGPADRFPAGGVAQHDEHTDDGAPAPDGYVQRPEGERQTRHELRKAPHGVLGVAEVHGPARAVRLGHREGTVHMHAPPGAHQGSGKPGEDRHQEQPRSAGAQVDAMRRTRRRPRSH